MKLISVRLIILTVVLILLAAVDVMAQTDRGRLYFDPETISVPVSKTVEVGVMIDTGGAGAGAAGVKLNYNANLIEVVDIKPTKLFADYPSLAYDNKLGKANISGVVSGPKNLFSGSGVMAVVVFKGKNLGTTDVMIEFTPNGTKDSNIAVISGTGDVLGGVGKLTVQVGAAGSQSSGGFEEEKLSGQAGGLEYASGDSAPENWFDKLIVFPVRDLLRGLGVIKSDVQTDSADLITRMPAKKSLDTSQTGSNNLNGAKSGSPDFLPLWVFILGGVAVVVLVGIVVVVWSQGEKQNQAEVLTPVVPTPNVSPTTGTSNYVPPSPGTSTRPPGL